MFAMESIVNTCFPTLNRFVVNTDNSKLKSLESFTSLCNEIVTQASDIWEGYTVDEYTRLAVNCVYQDRVRLGKAGHKLSDDARIAINTGMRTFPDPFPGILQKIEIHAPTEEEEEALSKARASFREKKEMNKAKKAARVQATTPTEPTPEPEPEFDPYTTFVNQEPPAAPEPEPVATPRLVQYRKPTWPGYIVPKEYGEVYTCLSNNQDMCLEGDASAGKSLLAEVLCETEEWNLIQMGHIKDAVDIFGFNNPIDHKYTPSKLVRALMGDPELLRYPGHKTVVAFDEGFVNLGDYFSNMLSLVGSPRGYLATDGGEFHRGDIVFIFIDNSVGDGGSTNYISRKPVDMAFKSRLYFIHMGLDPKIAKAICAGNKALENYCKWMRGSINRGKIDRLSLDNRGLHMINMMNPQTDEEYERTIYGAFLKGAPLNSIATLLKGVKATPEELMNNKYYLATQRCYETECKRRGVKPEPTNA